MSEVSINEINITDDLRTKSSDRRICGDRRLNDGKSYKKADRRTGKERRTTVRRQTDIDKLLENSSNNIK